jgi:hypothetical protein
MDPVVVHHLLVCLRARYDLGQPLAPYSLDNLTFRLRPSAGSEYPAVAAELWLFARVEGESECELWAEVVRSADDAVEEELVAAYGPFLVPFGAGRNTISRAWCLRGVPFPRSGWYEFRLALAGELVATEWVYLEE